MKIGEAVENFILKDQHGNEFDLYKNLDSNILLVFYPKDNTLVCTKQLRDYSVNNSLFSEFGIKIIGVNIDPVELHLAFCEQNNFDFPILSDKDKAVSKKFGAIGLFGMNKRKLVLIGKDKRLKFIRTTSPVNFLNSQSIIAELKKSQLI